MINAKEELLESLDGKAKIKCASIEYKDLEINLKTSYSKEEYEHFLNSFDFKYDNGYGWQELYGIVWLEDGTWISRDEYDGSEWWLHNVFPEIPEELK